MNQAEVAKLGGSFLLQKLGSSLEGLSHAEATARLKAYGPNSLPRETNTGFKVLVHQFQSSLIYLLVFASILAFWLQDRSDGSAIAVILVLNAGLGFWQEYRSEKTVEHLASLVKRHALVRREGTVSLVDQTHLVPGDLLVLREGDIVPADAKLLESENLSVDESALSGESLPLSKGAGQLVFTGTTIQKGEAVALVFATGSQSELGKIAKLSSQTHRVTRYEQSLQDFSSFLIKITLGGLLFILVIKVLIAGSLSELSTYLLFMIALAVAVVPEAMPVITTLTLASGALRLAKQHVVVKKLSSIEDLGNISILCTDKTGTLTENHLVVTEVKSSDHDLLLTFALAAAEVAGIRRNRFVDAFDRAFSEYASPTLKKEAAGFQKLKELPFDPEARRRRVLIKGPEGIYLVVVGATETILELSKARAAKPIMEQVRLNGRQGWRSLAFAYRTLDTLPTDLLKEEKELHFLGYVSLSDPLKASSRQTIAQAQALGVAVKILSGDSAEVVEHLAREVGLLKPGERVYSGPELESMPMRELRRIAHSCPAFAKVSPTQKYAIIKFLKEEAVVGYQGDGINDAPSLKLADVGIAVDQASDVAKASADILLLKEDLSVIINGIGHGRRTFANINKYLKHTMVGNFGSFFALGALFLFSSTLPLLTIQLLFSNILTDLPLIAIATDNVAESELLTPSRYDVRLVMLTSILLGVVTTLVQLAFFLMVGKSNLSLPEQQTLLFVFITLLQLLIIFSVRNQGYLWKLPLPTFALGFSVLLTGAISALLPYLPLFAGFFGFVPLSGIWLALMVLVLVIYLMLLDIVKVSYNRIRA